MKVLKRLLVLIGVMAMMFSFTACSSSSDEGTESSEATEVSGPKEVKVYTMDGKFNSETENVFRNLYIEDEENYTLIIQAVHSEDSGKFTIYYCAKGIYTTNDDGTITLKDGDGIGYILNGEVKMDWSDQDMDYLMDCDDIRDFTLNADGTWSPVK